MTYSTWKAGILAAGRGAILACLLVSATMAFGQSPAAAAPKARVPALGARVVAGSETAYVSDYVSFAGRDATGFVAFALDTNRGRAGPEYQAEHFVALFDEREGWVEIDGYDSFPNAGNVLLGYPESPYFEFVGEPYALESIAARSTALTLSIGTLTERVTRHDEETVFSMASARATLFWKGRRVEGRVIYEYLALRGANRLAGASLGSVLSMLAEGPDFQGLYLASDDGDDIYVHLARASAATVPGDALVAFTTHASVTQRIEDLVFEVTDFDPAFGFYRWPGGWDLTWQSECGDAHLSVETLAHDTESNWIVGGFAMRAVRGTFVCGARNAAVYGFGELIR